MRTTCTLYIGNLSFYTTEEQIYTLFSSVGELKRIIMGLDKFKRTPCGFCFVEYYRREDAESALKYLSKTRLDDRVIRCDLDPGFEDGRQFGRGKSGGQVRDEYRQDYDTGRGGWGVRMRGRVYDEDEALPGGGQMYSGRGDDYGVSKHGRDETDDFGGQVTFNFIESCSLAFRRIHGSDRSADKRTSQMTINKRAYLF